MNLKGLSNSPFFILSITMTQENQAAQQALDAEIGKRHPAGPVGKLIAGVALAWSLFQLWYASPLPFVFGIGMLNDTEARSIHLAFAVFLAFMVFPYRKSVSADCVPVYDWVLALAAAFSASYLFLFYVELSDRSGLPTTMDLIVAGIGMVTLLEGARRSLGLPLVIVAGVFLIYTFAGPHMPDVIAHKGASFEKVMSHQWLATEGVFGVALGVSTGFVFLFVLFGSLLEQAGAGRWFIQVAFALLGRFRGGPAKAAVMASGMSGLISGSSIANVVTTGTFTIPLMKRAGFPATKAGAVEVAASTNGQLTPPIMGAAAFLMVEYVGISYLDVVKHAILPALLSYMALFYIVHLEALKADMQPLKSSHTRTALAKLTSALTTFVGLGVLTIAMVYLYRGISAVFGDLAGWVLIALAVLLYLVLIYWASGVDAPDEGEDDLSEIPPLGQTMRAGLYFMLPVFVLVWCLGVERFSPGLAAFWAVATMILVLMTHRPLRNLLRKQDINSAVRRCWNDLITGLINGARNMIGVGIATATAGVVVGTVTLTGVGLVMTELVELLSGGNLLLMLVMTAFISLLLGLGLPTTANYIVVSTLMAPVIVTLGAEHGLVVPLIAVHLFVFYFGILADDTPPVGLAAYAAAGIARADPIKTGLQGFGYDIRTAVLPFMFIFNTQLLLIGIGSVGELIVVVLSAVVAMLIFAAATQGWWLTRNRLWETLAMLLIAFTLFRPDFWWDRWFPAQQEVQVTQLEQVIDETPDKGFINMTIKGINFDGDEQQKQVSLRLTGGDSAEQRLNDAGIILRDDEGRLLVDMVEFGSQAQELGVELDWEIVSLLVDNERPSEKWMFLPSGLLLLLIGVMQRARRKRMAV